MRRSNVTLDEGTIEALRAMSKERGWTASFAIRECVRMAVERMASSKVPSPGKDVRVSPAKARVSTIPKTCPRHGGFWASCGCLPGDHYELI